MTSIIGLGIKGMLESQSEMSSGFCDNQPGQWPKLRWSSKLTFVFLLRSLFLFLIIIAKAWMWCPMALPPMAVNGFAAAVAGLAQQS